MFSPEWIAENMDDDQITHFVVSWDKDKTACGLATAEYGVALLALTTEKFMVTCPKCKEE